MDTNKTCPRCLHQFSSSQRLISHLKRQVPCQVAHKLSPSEQNNRAGDHKHKKFFCEHCLKGFTRNDSLIRHQKSTCQSIRSGSSNTGQHQAINSNHRDDDGGEIMGELIDPTTQTNLLLTVNLLAKQMVELKEQQIADSIDKSKKIAKQEKEINELKEKPNINNQVLQVICFGNNDNYLDMLTDQWGDFDRALEYIKDCALSSLRGDCKLIEKIYLGESPIPDDIIPSIQFADKNRTKIEYFNEKKQKIVDSKELFLKKIANNLQNSYLKGVNYLITKNLQDHKCPNKFLEEYDLQIWNQHIYDLSDQRYQKKIIGQLNIPIKKT